MSTDIYTAEEDQPLDFGFIKDPPGEMILLDSYKLHVDCEGSGDVTVLFEAGLGGSSLEWKPVQRGLSGRVRACLYDRAGYAWSHPSPYPRHATQLARESAEVLHALNDVGPLILVGHSFGGFVIRELATLLIDSIDIELIGMVLIDASHENQLVRLETDGAKSVMPTGGNFVISPIDVPDNLPKDIQRKIQAMSRMRKTYAATHAEMSLFRKSAEQVRTHRERIDFPLVVLARGRDLYPADARGNEKNRIWQELQKDLAAISSRGTLVRAAKSGHHIHADDPALVVRTIESILDDFEKE